jgi:hypothetical protein
MTPLRWRAAARGEWHEDADAAVAEARRLAGTAAAWIECDDGARVPLDAVQRVDGDDLPPDPWEPDGDLDEAFIRARLAWRALHGIGLDDLGPAVMALSDDDLRSMVFVRALFDMADRAWEERQ